METDHENPPTTSSVDAEEAKNRFLESMGLGDNALQEIANSDSVESSEDEGVVLSSGPEDLDLPGADNQSVSIRVHSSSGVKVSASRASITPKEQVPGTTLIPEEAMPSVEEAIQEEVEAEPNLVESENDSLIHLNCPKCDGELVLRNEHLGIDGACVWCEMPIVAAKSGVDGEVRVFPIFNAGPTEPVVEPVPELEEESEPESAAEPLSEAPAVVDASGPAVSAIEQADIEIPEILEKDQSPAAEIAAVDWSDGSAAMTGCSDFSEATLPAVTDTDPMAPTGFSESEPEKQEAVEMPASEAIEPSVSGFTSSDVPTEEASEVAPNAVPQVSEAIEPAASGFTSSDVPTEEASEVAPNAAPSVSEAIEPAVSGFTSSDVPTEEASEVAPNAVPQDFNHGFSGGFAPPETEFPVAPVEDQTTEPIESPTEANSDAAGGFDTPAGWGQPTETAPPLKDEPAPATSFSGSAEATPEVNDDVPPAMNFQGADTMPSQMGFDGAAAPSAETAPFNEAPTSEMPGAFSGSSVPSGFGLPNGGGDSPPVLEEASAQEAPFSGKQVSIPIEAPTDVPSMSGFTTPDPVADDTQPVAFSPVDASPAPEVAPEVAPHSGFGISAAPSTDLAFGSLPPAQNDEAPAPASSSFGVPSTSPLNIGVDQASIVSQAVSEPSVVTVPALGEEVPASDFTSPILPIPEGMQSSPIEAPAPSGGDAFASAFSTEPAKSTMFDSGSSSEGGLFGSVASAPSALMPESEVVAEEPIQPITPRSKVEETAPEVVTPEEDATAAETGSAPNVISQPLGAKPKVRKGFIVLMVILVGFVCGASLASFVLPVDEYVAKGRAMMVQKFNPSGLVAPSPALMDAAPSVVEPPVMEEAPGIPDEAVPPLSVEAMPQNPDPADSLP